MRSSNIRCEKPGYACNFAFFSSLSVVRGGGKGKRGKCVCVWQNQAGGSCKVKEREKKRG